MWTKLFSRPWLGCFGVAGACIGLQLSPLGFLLVFLTFYPSILFLNLGFVLLAVDAWRGRLPSLALIAPILWFGVYYAAALLSYGLSQRLENQLDAHNATTAIKWTRATPLLILSDTEQAVYLVDEYGLEEVFSRDASGRGESGRLRLVMSDCPTDRSAFGPDVSFQWVSDGGYPTDRPHRFAKGICKISDKHEPDRTPLVISVGPQTWRSGLLRGYSQTLSVAAPGQTPKALMAAGPSWTLAWLPMPMVGCHLRGGFGDQWDRGCSAEFMHVQRKGERRDAVAVVAKALGLRASKISNRFPSLKWRCMDVVFRGKRLAATPYCSPE